MPRLEVLTRQPDFPKEDLTDTNAAYIEYMLRHERSSQPYAELLRGSLRSLHVTGHQALLACGVEVDYSKDEYDAFCEGFAALEYTAEVVGQRLFNGNVAVKKTQELFIDGGALLELTLVNRFKAWQDTHPNTLGVITVAGEENGETMKQLQARAMGAELAFELRDDDMPLLG